MNKADMALLEKLFAADMAEVPIYQERVRKDSKHMLDFEARGLAKRANVTLPGRFPVKINGWQITTRGHLLYCESCSDIEAQRNDAAIRSRGEK